jgi:CheY-like chemotaxis protein
LNILLTDDDIDDCLFFKKALEELPAFTHLTTVGDGEQLMDYLSKSSVHFPDVLFLDLSMPRKNGIECLTEIKENEKLKDLYIIMFTTSSPSNLDYDRSMVDILSKLGANDFIHKTSDFVQLKQVIHNALIKAAEKIYFKKPLKDIH